MFYMIWLLKNIIFLKTTIFKSILHGLHKQPSRGVLTKRCSENIQKFTGEHPYRGAISIKLQSNFIEITIRHGCSPVNFCLFSELLFLRTPLEGYFWVSEYNQNVATEKTEITESCYYQWTYSERWMQKQSFADAPQNRFS